jgi:hypothetical protein
MLPTKSGFYLVKRDAVMLLVTSCVKTAHSVGARVLRRTFKPKTDEVTGDWRNIHTEELYSLYSSPNIRMIKIKEYEICEACSMHGRSKRCVHNFIGKPEERKSHMKPRCKWEDNIKVDLREVGREGVDWIYLAENMYRWRALVDLAVNLQVP